MPLKDSDQKPFQVFGEDEVEPEPNMERQNLEQTSGKPQNSRNSEFL